METRREIVDDKDEIEHFKRIVESFKLYHFYATKRVAKSLSYYHELNEKQRSYVPDFEENCKEALKCIDHNNKVINLIIEDSFLMFENKSDMSSNSANLNEKFSRQMDLDVDRVNTTLKQIVRDWSSEGKRERELCYEPILDELYRIYDDIEKKDQISVLVPGCGLGRLAFEIASKGFKCQGNEFSLHMLITSNFILNKCYESNQHKIFPYVNNWSNNQSFNDQVRSVSFPDISPSEITSENENLEFSMAAGEFLEIYTDKEQWNCVITCFFIDTAHNIIEYVERIWEILKPDSYWINLGPLLYHFSDMKNEKSLELSYEQLKHIVNKVGFKFLKEQVNLPSTYLDNSKSMLKYSYDSVFFVVKKPNN